MRCSISCDRRMSHMSSPTRAVGTRRHTCIGFDNYAASTRLTEHLLELGHRNFGMIAHDREENDRIQLRIAAVQDTLARSGLAIRPQHFVRVNSRHIASGREGMRQILADDKLRPTALVCTNDYIATGAMIEAKELGLAIPGDLSIVGFDDTDMSAHLDPPLTTARVPSRRMGEEIANYIIGHLENGTTECPPPLEAELIIRNSTAPPARHTSRDAFLPNRSHLTNETGRMPDDNLLKKRGNACPIHRRSLTGLLLATGFHDGRHTERVGTGRRGTCLLPPGQDRLAAGRGPVPHDRTEQAPVHRIAAAAHP